MEDKDEEKARERAKEVLRTLSGLSFIEIQRIIWWLQPLLDQAKNEMSFTSKYLKD